LGDNNNFKKFKALIALFKIKLQSALQTLKTRKKLGGTERSIHTEMEVYENELEKLEPGCEVL